MLNRSFIPQRSTDIVYTAETQLEVLNRARDGIKQVLFAEITSHPSESIGVAREFIEGIYEAFNPKVFIALQESTPENYVAQLLLEDAELAALKAVAFAIKQWSSSWQLGQMSEELQVRILVEKLQTASSQPVRVNDPMKFKATVSAVRAKLLKLVEQSAAE